MDNAVQVRYSPHRIASHHIITHIPCGFVMLHLQAPYCFYSTIQRSIRALYLNLLERLRPQRRNIGCRPLIHHIYTHGAAAIYKHILATRLGYIYGDARNLVSGQIWIGYEFGLG